jgi:hypothetical protein
MSIRSQIKFYVESSRCCDLNLTIRDAYGQSISHNFSQQSACVLKYEFDDESLVEHFLRLEFSGKTGRLEYAQESVRITKIQLDHLDLTSYFQNIGLQYHHNGNGYGPAQVDKSGLIFGCDGYVKLNFVSPVYKWIRSVYQTSRFA